MTRKANFPHVLSIFCLVLLLGACVPAASEQVTATAQKPTGSPQPAGTQTLTRTHTPQPTETPIPTETPVPGPDLPSGEPPAVVAGLLISPENAGRVVELAGWGEGYEFNLNTIRSGQVVMGGRRLIAYEPLPQNPEYPNAVRLRFWDLPSGSLRLEMLIPQGFSKFFAAPDGTYYATYMGNCPNEARTKCMLEIWSVGTDSRVLEIGLDFLDTAVFSTDNHWIALGMGQEVQVWDLRSGELAASLPDSASFDRVLFSHDGHWIAGFGQWTENMRVWPMRGGQPPAMVTSQQFAGAFYPGAVAFSPDDKRLAVGFNWAVGLWDTEDWNEGTSWIAHEAPVTQVVFSPDGMLIASGAEDGSITLSDPSSGSVLAKLFGHSGWIQSLSFTEDGKLLISTAQDGTLRFWGVPDALL